MLSGPRMTKEILGDVHVYEVAADAVVHQGGMVVLDAGYADAGKAGAGLVSVGRAEETVDNTGGADGAKTVKVKRGVFSYANSATDPIDETHIRKTAYVEDDETLAATDGTGTLSAAGKIIGLDGTDAVLVELR
ncbi:hypothetical protein GGD81_001372 [Rhodobium orientis]|uniref:DUF2190 domain-containing protein n=1 Tax=Rhodobium orientis TaxID=34017 RepID=A0A327JP11_9HYPH|nr:hypothetical protein [Rhodobium orientis]MBB4302345.1 hypothetical protein [Rhodobium orientis]MBK5949050.1 hypothetical protein [Rhodobium orientis]RAI26622.1 hypothetical protein CH339_13560 [Rhodobium orientis]